jgi:hypothetical protein
MILLYFDGLLEFFIFFHLAFFSKKEILSTNGTAFMGSLNGKKEKKRRKKWCPHPNFAQGDTKNLLTMEFHIN